MAQHLDGDGAYPLVMSSNGCFVETGRWLDPYDDIYYYSASSVQIDHVVALYESWVSGLGNLSTSLQRRYANTGSLTEGVLPGTSHNFLAVDHFGPLNDACDGLISLPASEHNGMLWIHPKPDGELNIAAQLGQLDEEITSHDFARYVYSGETVLEMNLNWKLANDTFGETYHFQKLHRDTLGQIFYGDNLSYETFGCNHRFVFASKGIDLLRALPESDWKLDEAANLLYFLFPNIQLNIGGSNIAMIKMYPHPSDPGKSLTRISFYFTPEMIAMAAAAKEGKGIEVVDADNVYEEQEREGEVAFTLEAITEVFSRTIADQDYLMGEQQQAAAESGLLPHVWFGRNEPALHHYHNTFREALGMPLLEPVFAEAED
jgi:phenylpropionate dioxygenase-like ring-hydroxylating dioxygenase large terminal subunit